jgi:hypothetical protein
MRHTLDFWLLWAAALGTMALQGVFSRQMAILTFRWQWIAAPKVTLHLKEVSHGN